MSPTYTFAALALAFVAVVLMMDEQLVSSSGGAITSDDPSEGSWTDLSGLASEAMNAITPASFGNPTALSQGGLQALMGREGFSSVPYPDHKGNSIGYGHLILPGESFGAISQEQGAQLLAQDVSWAVAAVCSNVVAPVNQNQFDALVSFCFNVGAGAFARSTLVRRINAYDPGAADEFARWVYASGVVNSGLVSRRQDERNQFESA